MGPYLGDFAEDATVHFMWDTNDSSGASVTRATDGSIRVYKDNGVSEKTTGNGVTDTEDFDSLTGIHVLTIDTSNDTGDADFWVTGSNYVVVLVAATIDGQTVNAVLCSFSIENRGVAIAKAVWDRVLAGNTHNIASSAGRRLRQLEAVVLLDEGTATAGAAGSITLEVGSNSNDEFFDHALIVITGGTGVGQARSIDAYTGGTLVAAVVPDWVTNPASGSTYSIYAAGEVHVAEIHGTALADINAQVVDVMRTDTVAEVSAVPAANAPLHTMMQWLFSLARNKRITTATVDTLRNDADGADIGSAVISEDENTFTRNEYS